MFIIWKVVFVVSVSFVLSEQSSLHCNSTWDQSGRCETNRMCHVEVKLVGSKEEKTVLWCTPLERTSVFHSVECRNVTTKTSFLACCESDHFCNGVLLEHWRKSRLSDDQAAVDAPPSSLADTAWFAVIGLVPLVALCWCLLKRWKTASLLSLNAKKLEYRLDLSVETSEPIPSTGGHLLSQRTIHKELLMSETIGRGRFGLVYRAEWRGLPVAVKVMSSRDESEWNNEVSVYRMKLFHDSVLNLYGCDRADGGVSTELYLVMEYCTKQSLLEFLSQTWITAETLYSMTRDIASAIDYLHTPVMGVHLCKPSIAHFDLKSKNVLVTDQIQCKIADFGLAVWWDAETHSVRGTGVHREGTLRYQPPEVLTKTMNRAKIEDYKKADIYSMALVFWELLNRLVEVDCTTDYRLPRPHSRDRLILPYDGWLPEYGVNAELMRKLICEDNIRPPLADSMNISLEHSFSMSDAVDPRLLMMIDTISQIVTGCWCADAAVRLSSKRVLNSLIKLRCDLAAGDAPPVEPGKPLEWSA